MTGPSPYDHEAMIKAYEDFSRRLREMPIDYVRPAIRIEDLAGIPRDEVRRKYKAEHPSIDAMQGEVHEGEQDV